MYHCPYITCNISASKRECSQRLFKQWQKEYMALVRCPKKLKSEEIFNSIFIIHWIILEASIFQQLTALTCMQWDNSAHSNEGNIQNTHTHTHTRLTAIFPGLPGWAGTRKVKPMWILLKQKSVSGSGISWAICKSTPRSRQITTPVPHHSEGNTQKHTENKQNEQICLNCTQKDAACSWSSSNPQPRGS